MNEILLSISKEDKIERRNNPINVITKLFYDERETY